MFILLKIKRGNLMIIVTHSILKLFHAGDLTANKITFILECKPHVSGVLLEIRSLVTWHSKARLYGLLFPDETAFTFTLNYWCIIGNLSYLASLTGHAVKMSISESCVICSLSRALISPFQIPFLWRMHYSKVTSIQMYINAFNIGVKQNLCHPMDLYSYGWGGGSTFWKKVLS